MTEVSSMTARLDGVPADFSDLSVLVLGDLMLDCWIHGRVERI